jgi:hypothetical protein
MTKNDQRKSKYADSNAQPYAVKAVYKDPIVPTYQGNPNIEALPPILEENEWAEFLTVYPDFEDSLRNQGVAVRNHILEEIRRTLYQPFSTSTSFAVDFDVMVRSGYITRNPFNPEHRRNLLEKYDQYKQLDIQKLLMNEFDQATFPSYTLAIMGLSGMGKTRLIRRVLAYYPQIIEHGTYQDGRPLLYKQVVHLMFSCPPNGTLRAFAEDALIALGNLLGKDYYSQYVSQKGANTNTLLQGFLAVASEHYLGALILDEIANLYGAKEGKILKNFLLLLANDFQIPLVLIGSPLASNLLSTEFRQLRRMHGSGEYNHWVQMNKDSKNWNIFTEALFKYQIVKRPAKKIKKLQSKLHDISGGVTDLAVKMFLVAQKQAMRDDTEEITPGLLNFVADNQFTWARDAVNALRLGTKLALQRYEDLYFEKAKRFFNENHNSSSSIIDNSAPEPEPTKTINSTETNPDDEPKKKAKGSKTRGKKQEPEALLLALVKEGHENKKSAYESLKDAGWIGSIQEYL